jgi:hypothetical protein
MYASLGQSRTAQPAVYCNGKLLFYKSSGASLQYENGYRIENIESIDTSAGSQNVFDLKNCVIGTSGLYGNTQNMAIASVLITS